MSATRPQKGPVRVLIVGGGIAGLSLALALEHAPVDIEYLLFEAKDTLSPEVGASIGLAPNGSRILDQLGVYQDLEKLLEPVASAGLHDAQGRCLTGDRADWFQLIPKRMSYPVAFLERRDLLKILAAHIRRKECIFTGKKVGNIEQNDGKAVILCTDGTSYRGDLIVGADGIHSTTRSEMWKAAEKSGAFDVRAEKKRLTAEYKCLFGISNPVAGLTPGSYDVTHAQAVSTLVITGKGGKIYWFLFGRMPQVHTNHDIPRFTPMDAEAFAVEHRALPIRPHGRITMGHIWEARERATLTSLEEADFQNWSIGRIVCLGDSSHKMTPNSGSGGMLALESAAALANAIYRVTAASAPKTPEIGEITRALRAFEDGMHERASSTIKSAADVTRLQALHGSKERILTRYILPYVGDFTVNEACESWVGAGCLDYLPLPPRSLLGNTSFNPTQGIGKQENIWTRIALVLPLLALSFMHVVVPSGEQLAHSTSDSFKDDYLFADGGIVYAIILIESARRANQFNILRFATVWGMLALHPNPFLAVIYSAVHYILSPVSAFKSGDMRTTDTSYTSTVLPMTLLAHSIPGLATYFAPTSSHWQTAENLWKFLPLVVSITQAVLTRYLLAPSTIQSDRLNNVRRDLPAIQRTIWGVSIVSAAIWQYTIWSNPEPWAALQVVGTDPMLRLLANTTWASLFIWDLKAAGMVQVTWAVLFAYSIGLTIIGGSGTMLGLAWLYRENILATQKHKDALVYRGEGKSPR
ncbi:hypothetical protein BDW59DRAFT_147668 [Aspergillus cavernicola]|uniref:FAD-binding domain-containing protein n=1 Tax=Aspergillus cavernicola TaxID=176166 RepID=A0ABR4I923_9EURO